MSAEQEGKVISKEEIDQLNRLLLQLIDVDDIRNSVELAVDTLIMNDPLEYIDEEGNITVDRQALIDQEIEREFENHYDGPVPTILYEFIQETFDTGVWETAEETIREAYQEQIEYRRDPLAYHGLSQRDFL